MGTGRQHNISAHRVTRSVPSCHVSVPHLSTYVKSNERFLSEFYCCAFCVCVSMFPPAHWEPKQLLSSLASNNALHCYQRKLKIFSQQFPQQQLFFPCSPFRRPICGRQANEPDDNDKNNSEKLTSIHQAQSLELRSLRQSFENKFKTSFSKQNVLLL